MNWTLYADRLGLPRIDLLILVRVLLSWINLGPPMTWCACVPAHRAILAPLRRYIPPFGGLDITPMVALMLLELSSVC